MPVFLSSLCCIKERHVPAVSHALCFFFFFFVCLLLWLHVFLCRSTLANYCHCSFPGWPVSGCSRTAAGPCGSTRGNYNSGEGNTQSHTMAVTWTQTKSLQALLTGHLIGSQTFIIKIEKCRRHPHLCLCGQSLWDLSRIRESNLIVHQGFVNEEGGDTGFFIITISYKKNQTTTKQLCVRSHENVLSRFSFCLFCFLGHTV